jgi:hypothetical protein
MSAFFEDHQMKKTQRQKVLRPLSRSACPFSGSGTALRENHLPSNAAAQSVDTYANTYQKHLPDLNDAERLRDKQCGLL